jgi:Rrf2 family protein
MKLLSNRSMLTICAVVDIATYSRFAPVSRTSLGLRHKLSRRHLEPVLQALARAGILRGLRGPHGGYVLARDPDCQFAPKRDP